MSREYLEKTAFVPKSQFDAEIGYFDEFGSQTHWFISGDGAGYYGERNPKRVNQGDYALFLSTRETGQAIDDNVRALKYIGLIPPRKLSFSFYILPYAKGMVSRFGAYIRIGNPGNTGTYTLGFYIDPITKKVYIIDKNNAELEIGTFAGSIGAQFHRIEIVVDLINGKYIEARFGSFRWNLSAYEIYFDTGSIPGYTLMALKIIAKTAATCQGFYDSILFRALD